ncbi:MAG: hypothetical protein V4467_04400 [Patescibacteria group bacterium]
MKSHRRVIVEAFSSVCGVVLVVFNIIFGVESQVNPRAAMVGQPIHFTFKEYLEGTARANGNTFVSRVLAVGVYPGVRVGQCINNWFFVKPRN